MGRPGGSYTLWMFDVSAGSGRRMVPELMDDPALEAGAHRRALVGLARINRVSGSAAAVWGALRAVLGAEAGRRLRVLDVACGSADVSTALQRRADAAGLRWSVDGCDLSPVAVDAARQRAAAEGLKCRFFEHDALGGGIPAGYDAVVCSLFLHHLRSEDVVGLLGRMAAAAPVVVVDDLRRDAVGFLAAWVGTRVLSASPVVHVDGPRSVAAALTPDELAALAAEAGLAGALVRRRRPWRMVMTWRRR